MNRNINVMIDLENKVKALIEELENLKNKSELYDSAKNELSEMQNTLQGFKNIFDQLRSSIETQTNSINTNFETINDFKTELEKIDELMKKSVSANTETIDSFTQEFKKIQKTVNDSINKSVSANTETIDSFTQEFKKIQKDATKSINDNVQQTKNLETEIELISSELTKINQNFKSTNVKIFIGISVTIAVGILGLIILSNF